MRNIFRGKSGEGYVDVIVVVLCAMLVVALAVKVFPVFIAKQQLNAFANELCRTAEIAGQVGYETDVRTTQLEDQTGITPTVSWSASYIPGTKRVQLNGNIEVTTSYVINIGLFGNFDSFPITITSKATGRSEVYWKGF